ncbi:hypothetical protein Tco_1090084 [Tanacetum coccineum]|uniref:Uncharacterized protein n=1 Tax=Tanacetum coccineum TaxID=301880 RepID=A0ABQ5I3H5_9ASTR
MFDTTDLHGDEVVVDMLVGEKQEQNAKEKEVNTSVEDSAAPTTIEEITLVRTLIQIKAAKPKVVTTATTTTTTIRPKARGVVVQEPSEFKTPQEAQPSSIKDKGKAIIIIWKIYDVMKAEHKAFREPSVEVMLGNGSIRIHIEQGVATMKGYRGGTAAEEKKKRGHVLSYLTMEESKLLSKLLL